MNFAEPEIADELAFLVNRWGDNAVEQYNWRRRAVNTGHDYCFENIADGYYFASDCAKGNTPRYQTFVDANLARGTQPSVQLPMLG